MAAPTSTSRAVHRRAPKPAASLRCRPTAAAAEAAAVGWTIAGQLEADLPRNRPPAARKPPASAGLQPAAYRRSSTAGGARQVHLHPSLGRYQTEQKLTRRIQSRTPPVPPPASRHFPAVQRWTPASQPGPACSSSAAFRPHSLQATVRRAPRVLRSFSCGGRFLLLQVLLVERRLIRSTAHLFLAGHPDEPPMMAIGGRLLVPSDRNRLPREIRSACRFRRLRPLAGWPFVPSHLALL